MLDNLGEESSDGEGIAPAENEESPPSAELPAAFSGGGEPEVLAEPHESAAALSKLDPPDQAQIISVSSAVVLGFILAVAWRNQHLYSVPKAFIIADSIFVGLSLLWLFIGKPVTEALSRSFGIPQGDIWYTKVDNLFKSERVASFFIWSAAAAQFGSIGYLIMQTGGLIDSPYAPILTTFLAFAPYVMNGGMRLNGAGSILLLWVGGVTLLSVMAFLHPFLRHLNKPHDDPVSAWPYWVNHVGTVSIAIAIAVGIKLANHKSIREL